MAIVDIQSKPIDLLDELKTKNPNIRIVYFECDISVKDELEATFNSIVDIFQRVDILINAAGIFNDKNVQLTFKVNVVRYSVIKKPNQIFVKSSNIIVYESDN